jgi:8-oxo-dGTP pyrophosphatase MutT (NUDIX family)
MNINSLSGQIESALREELPGTDVQWEMASSDRKISNFPRKKRDDTKLAAVLIVLYPHKDKVHTLFIQRPVYNGVHSGQIAFPGGKLEEEDNSLISTALREACEETGICSSDIQVLGKLTPLYIPVSNIEVTPVVASMHMRPELVPCQDEVVSIIEASLADFTDPVIIKEKAMLIRDESLEVRYFDYKGNVIWGATAMMLYELLVLLEKHSISLPQ